ncbi:alpha/beta fold hydrolase [Pontibacter ruber]|uniref:Alpha/beta fold hydrolase n=1 Tax=Pontibacter ruber TaxID=1343895 RepID=A0ABW5D0L6_9BACT|nr:alpha/beta hydrolase [Pontibacter ruber]
MANQITSRTYQVHNLDVHVSERQGKEPAIVLLHGVSMSKQVWQKQLESEALQDHHMISIELPGHGESGWSGAPADDYTLPGYAHLLTELLPQVIHEPYVIAGYSMGGNIAVEALPTLRGCIGLMVVNTAIADGKPADITKAFNQKRAGVLGTILKEQADDDELRYYARSFFAKKNKEMPNTLATDFKNTDPKARSILAQSVADGNHEDELALLKHAAVPVALVTGKKDRLGDRDYLKNLDIPKWRGETIIIPRAGHIPQLENSEDFDATLLAFVEHCQRVSQEQVA